MPNWFDRNKTRVVDIVSKLIGDEASWTSAGGPTRVARVLHRKPNNKEMFVKQEYKPFDYYAEYRKPLFPGLLEIVRGGGTEYIVLQGTTYLVMDAWAIDDGDNIGLKLKVKKTA